MSNPVMPKDYITANDLQKFGEDLSQRIVDDIADVLQTYIMRIDERFNKLETQVKQVAFQTGANTEY